MSFSSTRALKLHLDCIEDVVAGNDKRGGRRMRFSPSS
jgi:hypothetical protein